MCDGNSKRVNLVFFTKSAASSDRSAAANDQLASAPDRLFTAMPVSKNPATQLASTERRSMAMSTTRLVTSTLYS